MKNFQVLSAVLFTLAFYTGGYGQSPIDTSAASAIYESCCGATPVVYTADDAYMFVPNVFTPNNDGVNDYFVPSFNEQILGFDAYLIYSMEGNHVVFASAGYDPANIQNTAWDGMNRDGSVFTGGFRYQFTAFLKTGGLIKIEGKACRIVCGPEAAVFKTKTGCFYPAQANGTGYLDQSAPNNETGCFN